MTRIAVVGKGLFGVGAALHLSRAGCDVVLVGPDEPAPDVEFNGPHGAHFDEARILVARGNRSEIDLTLQTILGIMELQEESGEQLIQHSGSVEVLQRGEGDSQLIDGAVDVGAAAELVEIAPPQGFYNPRGYVRAGVAVLESKGASIVRHPATLVQPDRDGFSVRADEQYQVDRVVVAAGAWSNHFQQQPLALRLKREHVLFAELNESLAAAISMRPIVVHGRVGPVEDVYILPPLRYPDGRWYLKLGANTLHDESITQDEAIDAWYLDGDSSVAEDDLVAAFLELMPEVVVEGFHTERCVITYTAHGRPYIDEVPGGVVVCVGGNGHGASWADGAGKLAAALVTGEEWNGFDRESFRAVPDDSQVQWLRPLLMRDRG
ncbi:MAG: FAD-binding oxidoreductase [Acidimicrobiia bacterium]|nr:FAD-binding oxidoreductase [Acidimicrobiia bacterium]